MYVKKFAERLKELIGNKSICQIAKEIGKIDIGQSVVVKDKMILAAEAIEGTDKCIKRGARFARGKGAIVVKVAKPHQDQRFDIPAVGMNTLKVMKRHKANVLALEAGKTIIVEQEKMVQFANKHKIVTNVAIVIQGYEQMCFWILFQCCFTRIPMK